MESIIWAVTKQGRKIKGENQERKKFPIHMVKIRANLCYLALEIKLNFCYIFFNMKNAADKKEVYDSYREHMRKLADVRPPWRLCSGIRKLICQPKDPGFGLNR